jgi:hypothetical protein
MTYAQARTAIRPLQPKVLAVFAVLIAAGAMLPSYEMLSSSFFRATHDSRARPVAATAKQAGDVRRHQSRHPGPPPILHGDHHGTADRVRDKVDCGMTVLDRDMLAMAKVTLYGFRTFGRAAIDAA